jgi:signal transduction histidine kinase
MGHRLRRVVHGYDGRSSDGPTVVKVQDDELRGLLRPQVRRLSNLMQDLLDYGRPPRLRLVRGGVTDAVRRAVRSCERLASQAGVRVGLEIPGGLPELDLDIGRIEQVFENLIANAVQHSPRGATVRVAARAVDGPPPGVSLTFAREERVWASRSRIASWRPTAAPSRPPIARRAARLSRSSCPGRSPSRCGPAPRR